MLCNQCKKETKEENTHMIYKKGCLCKRCKAKNDKSYALKNKEKIASYYHKLWRENPERRKRNKLFKELRRTGMDATKYVEDKKCVVCGMTNEEHKKKYGERLHIHHLNNDGRHNIRKGLEPKHNDIMVLCRSCHVSKDNRENKKRVKI